MTIYTGLSKGLIIKAPFIDWILSGRKTWELRSSHTKQRGPIALILQGSGTVVGIARMVDSIGPLTDADMEGNFDRHAVAPERMKLPEVAKYRHAWVLSDVKRLARPVPYNHPNGAVKWVTLDPKVALSAIQGAG